MCGTKNNIILVCKLSFVNKKLKIMRAKLRTSYLKDHLESIYIYMRACMNVISLRCNFYFECNKVSSRKTVPRIIKSLEQPDINNITTVIYFLMKDRDGRFIRFFFSRLFNCN